MNADLTHVVYRHYSATGGLLYVGMTADYVHRHHAHSVSAWWPLVARSEVSDFMSKMDALRAEFHALRDESPTFNRMKSNGYHPTPQGPASDPEIVSAQISAHVANLLASAGISQRTAATQTGIPLTTLSRRLTGASPFLVTELAVLAKVLDTTVSALTASTADAA